jgi:putative membrane protein
VSPRLSLPLDEDLQERALARQQLSTEHLAAARQTLTHFLKAYPLRPSDLAELTQRGLEPMALDMLRAAQHTLADPNAPANDREWLRRFEQEFLGPLDAAAGQQTWRYMKAVGLFTATSSRGALDTLAVLVVSYKLVADLCTIYHVRAGRWGTTMILAHMLVNLVAASQVDAAADAMESQVHDWLHSSLAHLAGQVLGKVADGSVNALLLRRLSLRTQAYLRPVRKVPEPLQLSP